MLNRRNDAEDKDMKIVTKLMNIKSADSVFGSMWIIGSFVSVVLFFQASFYGESWAPFVVAVVIASSGKALLRQYEAQQDKSSPQ